MFQGGTTLMCALDMSATGCVAFCFEVCSFKHSALLVMARWHLRWFFVHPRADCGATLFKSLNACFLMMMDDGYFPSTRSRYPLLMEVEVNELKVLPSLVPWFKGKHLWLATDWRDLELTCWQTMFYAFWCISNWGTWSPQSLLSMVCGLLHGGPNELTGVGFHSCGTSTKMQGTHPWCCR